MGFLPSFCPLDVLGRVREGTAAPELHVRPSPLDMGSGRGSQKWTSICDLQNDTDFFQMVSQKEYSSDLGAQNAPFGSHFEAFFGSGCKSEN